MNRQAILNCVHRHLHESFVESGEVRPLGEIVVRVAAEIRNGSPAPSAPNRVIAIEKVAAFVDGGLESEESRLICDAAMVDNSVLAEIIAAVRSAEVSTRTLPPLSPSLSGRLLAMAPHGINSEESPLPLPNQDGPSAENAAHLEIAPLIQPTPTTGNESREKPSRNRTIARGVAAILAIAATIALAIVLMESRSQGPDPNSVVERPPQSPDGPPGEVLVPDPDPRPMPDPDDAIVESDTLPSADGGIVSPKIPPPDTPQDDVRQPDTAVASSGDPGRENLDPAPPQNVAVDRMPMPPPDVDPLRDPDPVRIADDPASEIRWTNVTGLFAQRSVLDQEGSRPRTKWRRIQEGVPSSTGASQSSITALHTLPFSRAEGELPGGGRIVVASDTALRVNQGKSGVSAEVDLMYGAVALVGLAEGTIVQVRIANKPVAMLRWQSKASAVVQRDATGMQIQIDEGEVDVNDTPVKEKSVRIASDRTIEEIRGPKRLPRWTTRPAESSATERMILAQIADTDDLNLSLNRKIAALAASNRLSRDEAEALSKLAHWQVAMAGPNLFRLASSRVPIVRLAALQRLADLSESDPRYKQTWKTIERSVANAQRVAQIRAWFLLVRSGRRPTTAELDQMAHGLASRDYAGRALADFMLRKYVTNPPPFDPSWSGQTLQRAINVYRQRAGLPAAAAAIDRARPNAAANGNANPGNR